MLAFNRVILLGNLVRDPSLRYAANGDALCEFRLAVDDSRRNRQNGEVIKRTLFIDVIAWSATAENCHRYLHQGSHILVEGRLQQEEWTTPEGQRRSMIRVVAANVQFLDPAPTAPAAPFTAAGADANNLGQ